MSRKGEPGDRSPEYSVTSTVDRRSLVIGSVAALTGVAAAGQSASGANPKPDRMPPQSGDRIQVIKGALKDEFVRPELLEVDARPFEAFPFDPKAEVLRRKNRLNRLLVIRLDTAEMDEETLGRSTDGVLVFSAMCTHRACTIKSWMPEERHLRCHCHLSEFAALSGGSVMSGPARRQLPMVPLGLDDDGFVIALDGFTRKPGGAKT